MPNLTRRAFVAHSSAALLAVPGLVRADIRLSDAATLTTLSDGHLDLPGDFIFGPMPQEALHEILARHGASAETYKPECNLALYRDGTNTVLFDAGAGPDFMPSAGDLPASLDAIGLAPEEVTHVVFTHAHPDHIWGLLDDFDEPAFAQAVYMMGQEEWDYWWNPETVHSIGEARAAFAAGAKRRMEAIEDRVALFKAGQEILPGVMAHPAFGHTPGHMAFEVRPGSEAAMIAGDAIGNPHVAFERPEWPSGSDQDQQMAAEARKLLLDRISAEQMQLVGFHLPGGGIGRAERSGDAFRFVPDGA